MTTLNAIKSISYEQVCVQCLMSLSSHNESFRKWAFPGNQINWQPYPQQARKSVTKLTLSQTK